MKKRQRFLAYTALLGNVLCWGLAIPIVKLGFDNGLTPNSFLFARMILAGLLAIPVVALLRRQSAVKKSFKLSNFLTIASIEAVGSVIALSALYLGLSRTSAVETTLISSTWPILLIFGGIIFFKEREQKSEVAGLLLALVGTFILVGRPILDGQINGHLSGNLLVFGYSLINTAYFLLAKRFYRGLNKWAVTFISFWVSTLGFGLIMATQGLSPLQFLIFDLWNFSFWPLFAIAYMATAGSILGLSLYLYGQDQIEASEASLFSYLYPVVGIPASILILHETVGALDLAALAIIVTGILIAQKR